MTTKINIFIPQPCHENWQEMTAVDKGRFCNSCQKKVIDFTYASDREITNAVKANENLCGRFNISQLNRDLIVPKEKSSIWVAASAAIISFLGIGTHNLVAQETAKTEQTDKKVLTNTDTFQSNEEIEVSGIVSDNTGPLPSAYVTVKGTNKATKTDINGNFKIIVPKNCTIVFGFTGYDTKEYNINNESSSNVNLNIKMEEAVVGRLDIKRTFFGRIFHSIGNWFK